MLVKFLDTQAFSEQLNISKLYSTNRKHKQIIVLRTDGAEYIITHELHNKKDYNNY